MEKIKLFRPSNGDQGHNFMAAYCERCAKHPINPDAKRQCGILMRTMMHNINDPEYPSQWRYVNGEPTCTAFKDRAEHNHKRRKALKNNNRSDDKNRNLF